MSSRCLLSVGLLLLLVAPAAASDHADPALLEELEAGITGLFAFPSPDGERLELVLCARRALTDGPPWDLAGIEYRIHLDHHTRVEFESAEDRARYGGTIPQPEGIAADVTVRMRLAPDGTLAERSIEGLESSDRVRIWAGVRDDPFIFPRFFGTNVLAMVVSVPFDAFPPGTRDWLIWGTTAREGWFRTRQVDHVGRSNRTMLPRFDFLNTVPPAEQVAAIERRHRGRGGIQGALMRTVMPLAGLYNLVFAIRHYDYAPDVMIFTTRSPSGFPNGRRLTDDVAALTCQQGDCLLWELSFADSERWPRATTNDKPFLDAFPYLAEPWPAR